MTNTTQNFIEGVNERIDFAFSLVGLDRPDIKELAKEIVKSELQSFARRVVEEIREEDSVRHKHNPLTVEEVVGIVLSLSGVEDPLRGLSGEDNQP